MKRNTYLILKSTLDFIETVDKSQRENQPFQQLEMCGQHLSTSRSKMTTYGKEFYKVPTHEGGINIIS